MMLALFRPLLVADEFAELDDEDTPSGTMRLLIGSTVTSGPEEDGRSGVLERRARSGNGELRSMLSI
jgi:hypothetical protein